LMPLKSSSRTADIPGRSGQCPSFHFLDIGYL
jgi:hypothetical protein